LKILLFTHPKKSIGDIESSITSVFRQKESELRRLASGKHQANMLSRTDSIFIQRAHSLGETIIELSHSDFHILLIYGVQDEIVLKVLKNIREVKRDTPIIIFSDKMRIEDLSEVDSRAMLLSNYPPRHDLVRELEPIILKSISERHKVVKRGKKSVTLVAPALDKEVQSLDIYIVDSEKASIDMAVETLTPLGNRVCGFQNGTSFLKRLRKEKPMLVLLDFDLPDLDGSDVLYWIRQRYTLEQLPVVMVSAQQDVSTVQALLAMGVSDYILKPINADRLKQVTRGVLDQIKRCA
jgi:CheY-like chemotaxis protein